MTDPLCPPTVFDVVTLSLSGRHGRYDLREIHQHAGGAWGICPTSCYTALTWTEAMDVVLAVLDSRRPGATPDGWEQLTLIHDLEEPGRPGIA